MEPENVALRGGFPHLARKMATMPDYETFIFRKFDRLSARNLLHLESKLAYLEWKLDRADEQAAVSQDNETLRSIRVWEAFEDNSKYTGRLEQSRMQIAEDIRDALREYQEALLRQRKIASLDAPKKRALRVAQSQSYESIYDGCTGTTKRRSILDGLAKQRLEENHGDLVEVRPQTEKDPLSRFLQDHWMFRTATLADDVEHIDEKHVALAAATVSTLVAAILLLGAIVLLRVIDRQNAQLGVIAMFMVLFVISVSLLTNARRAEVFASTAAYAAVLVVFVSSTPASASKGAT
ncbi:hypothetical protein NLG97_g8370 [Lecanicillium saksenae]|uniref:Uncharacterized protein n=1 Tax=Lecanicillium saksenae TaxID=468837 RepID=A0ACC1QJ72_9HYPO|nr:hypothetical protein NLG97_g8370 [Lecanicillium saksenae]